MREAHDKIAGSNRRIGNRKDDELIFAGCLDGQLYQRKPVNIAAAARVPSNHQAVIRADFYSVRDK